MIHTPVRPTSPCRFRIAPLFATRNGVLWQVCLAHLLRDAKYAIDCGDTAFSAPFRWLLLRATAIGRRRDTLKDDTLKQYLYDLDRRLDRIMAAVPIGGRGRKLHKRILVNRTHLFVFMTNRAVPCTNNVSERHLRPSVIFRKVPNGFRCERCEWGAETMPPPVRLSALRRPIALRCLIPSGL
jgi:transposase